MCMIYFSCGSVYYLLQGTWFNKTVIVFCSGHDLTKPCYANFYTFHINYIYSFQVETLSICLWVDLRDIFFSCGSVHYILEGSMIQQSLMTWTTSTVFNILTWNFKHMFSMKCRCAWHIFPVHYYTPANMFGGYMGVIIWLVGWSVPRTTPTVFKIWTWNFKYMFVSWFARHIFFFMWISSLFFWGEHDLTKSCNANYF
jgi:hypothetical protein